MPYNFNAGTPLNAWDLSTSLSWMPNDFITFTLQVIHRQAEEDYFAGHGGVTSPNGYEDSGNTGMGTQPGKTGNTFYSSNNG